MYIPNALRQARWSMEGLPNRSSPYFRWGLTGYGAATVLSALLAHSVGFPRVPLVALLVAAPLSFVLIVKLFDLALGYERIVFYELTLPAVGVSAVVAMATAQSVATAIDLATLGVGTFLAFGRLGCLRTGCCHGRAASRGVRYRSAHEYPHLPSRFAGVPLIPVQLFEAAVSGSMVALGCVAFLRGAAPGLAACIYAVGYASSRAMLEAWRGDTDRPHYLRISEAQWISIVILAGVTAWSRTAWSVVALAGATLVVALRARRIDARLLSPAHLDELESRLRLLDQDGGVVRTSTGVALSSGTLPDGRRDLVISWPGHLLTRELLVRLTTQMGAAMPTVTVVAGRSPSTWHLVETRGTP